MREKWTFTPSPNGGAHNIAAWEISNDKTDDGYLIQVSWPLRWESTDISTAANIIYLVDGNSVFFSATDVVRRRLARSADEPGTIVVGVGYPLTTSLYSPRRNYDLTPPCDNYVPPTTPDGRAWPAPHGGADHLLALIEDTIKPFLYSTVFPNVQIARSALFGHSFGALFTLHALFTQPALFDSYLAASPSIWWSDRFILSEETAFHRKPELSPHRTLRLSYGSYEQFPLRHRGESDEEYELRKGLAGQRRMTDNCNEMYDRMVGSGKLDAVEKVEYAGEDHGSVIASALSGAVHYFLGLE